MNLFAKASLFFSIAIFGASCVEHQELVNFQDRKLPLESPADIANLNEARIQPDDILRITVHSFNPAAAQAFNLTVGESGQSGANQNMLMLSGYLVDSIGNINFPVIGAVKIGGMTTHEATDSLQKKLLPYISDAVVNIRYLNFRFTILGEVNIPGTYTTMNKRITILEALGMAGDLSIYANRENILLVREKDGKRELARLNLKSDDVFLSAYYYLQQNDVIYVEPIPARVATVQDPVFRYITLGSAGLSLITLIISIFSK